MVNRWSLKPKFVIPSEVLHHCDLQFTELFPFFFSDDNFKREAHLGEAEDINEHKGKLTHEQIIWRPRVIIYNFLHNEIQIKSVSPIVLLCGSFRCSPE